MKPIKILWQLCVPTIPCHLISFYVLPSTTIKSFRKHRKWVINVVESPYSNSCLEATIDLIISAASRFNFTSFIQYEKTQATKKHLEQFRSRRFITISSTSLNEERF